MGKEDIKFTVIKHIKQLTKENTKGWRMELNIVSWNDGEPKAEIRSWNEDRTAFGKGITFTKEQLKEFNENWKEININEYI